MSAPLHITIDSDEDPVDVLAAYLREREKPFEPDEGLIRSANGTIVLGHYWYEEPEP